MHLKWSALLVRKQNMECLQLQVGIGSSPAQSSPSFWCYADEDMELDDGGVPPPPPPPLPEGGAPGPAPPPPGYDYAQGYNSYGSQM